MGLVTQLRVIIEGNADGLLSALAKTGRASEDAFSQVSRSAKQEFALATAEADKGFKEVARLNQQANRAETAGNAPLAQALRSQSAVRKQEAEQAALVAVSAEKRIQDEAAKTVSVHAAEQAGVSKLGGEYAQQGGAISRFFGAITSGSGGSTKALGELKTGLAGLVSGGGGLSSLTGLASTGLKGLATDMLAAGAAGKQATTGLTGVTAAGSDAAAGLGAAGTAGQEAGAGLLAAGAAGDEAAAGLGAAGAAGAEAGAGVAAAGAAGDEAAVGLLAAGAAGDEAAVGFTAAGTAATASVAPMLAIGAGLLVAAAAVAVTGKVIEDGTKNFENFGNEARKVQNITGQTAEQSSALAGVFRHFGIDVDAGSRAMLRFAKNIETSPKKIEDLGITIAHVGNSTKVDLVGSLENAAEAFQKLGKGAEGSNLLLTAFGRGGISMLPIMVALKGELKGINAETAKQGLIFNQEQINQAHALTLATTDLKTSFKGIEVTAAKGFAPVFTTMANDATVLLNALNAVEGGLGGVAGKIAGLDFKGLTGLVPLGGTITDVVSHFGGAIGKAGESGAASAEKLKQATAAVDEMGTAFEASTGVIQKAANANIGFDDTLLSLGKAFAVNGNSLDANTESGRKNITEAIKVADSAEKAGEAIAKSTGNTDKGTAAVTRNNAVMLQFLTTQLGSRDAAEQFAQKFGLIDAAGIKAAGGIKLTKDEMALLEQVTSGAKDELAAFNAELDKTTGKNLSASDANIHYHASLAEVQKQLLINGNTFDLNTKAGQDNQTAVNAGISSLEAYAKAEGDKTAAVSTASEGLRVQKTIIDEGTLSLIAMIAPMVGGTEQAKLLVTALEAVPPKVAPEFSTPGLPAAITSADNFAAAVQRARDAAKAPIVAAFQANNPFGLGFDTGGLRPPGNPIPGLAGGGLAEKGVIYQAAEQGQELFVLQQRNPVDKSAAAQLATRAETDAAESLVRLGIPAGIAPRSSHEGTPALLLGTHGPQLFTPPADGVIVNAVDTQRLMHTHDADVISDILKRAGADQRTLEALTDVPHRAMGGPVRKDETVLAGEHGPEAAFTPPTFNFSTRSTPSITTPGVKRGADGSYTFNIAGNTVTVEGNAQGNARGLSQSFVENLVDRKQQELVAELTKALQGAG